VEVLIPASSTDPYRINAEKNYENWWTIDLLFLDTV